MKQNLQNYVGRIVRLNKHVYEQIRVRAVRQGKALENSFLVASVGRGLETLVCYGASIRVVVKVADVILV